MGCEESKTINYKYSEFTQKLYPKLVVNGDNEFGSDAFFYINWLVKRKIDLINNLCSDKVSQVEIFNSNYNPALDVEYNSKNKNELTYNTEKFNEHNCRYLQDKFGDALIEHGFINFELDRDECNGCRIFMTKLREHNNFEKFIDHDLSRQYILEKN